MNIGNRVIIETTYGLILEGLILDLLTYSVLLQIPHKRHPIEIEYKDIKNINNVEVL